MLKSIFITAYITAASAVSVQAVQALSKGGPTLAWLGVLLAWGPIVLTVAVLIVRENTPRTRANFPSIAVLAVAGAALAGVAWLSGEAEWRLVVLAVAGLLAFLVYNFWYSRFGRRPSPALTVGNALPDLTFTDTDGNTVASSSFAGQPTVWLFYRGNWCPLCMAQVKELAREYRQMAAAGIRVALVSPQPQGKTAALAARFDVDFDFLVDRGSRAARALGIAAPHGLPAGMQALGYDTGTVLPTVIVTDPDNRVLWADETDNYRVRPEPETFFRVLGEHGYLAQPATR